ncbi:MAG: hypothetical protein CMN02_03205 [Roseibacillus sp.]|nr:hypothetical protein [Roseibacillus sp.]
MHLFKLITRPTSVGAVIIASLCFLLPLNAAPDSLVQTVTFEDQTLTMLLTRQDLRGSAFGMRRQQSGGGIRRINPVPERSYLGNIAEIPGAICCGVQLDDGTLKGAIIFKRGTAWYTLGDTVIRTEAIEYQNFTDYIFPTEATVAPGQGGSTMYEFDLAIDVASSFYNQSSSDPALRAARTLEKIEFDVNLLRALYMRDALIRPYLSRIVLRSDVTSDPYIGTVDYSIIANRGRTEWSNNQSDSDRDIVAVVTEGGQNAGWSWFAAVGTSNGVSAIQTGPNGDFKDSLLRQIGFNWDSRTNSGGNPEGRGSMGAGGPLRISGCENFRMLSYRNSIATNNIIDSEGPYSAVELPPYASLDTIPLPPRQMTGSLLVSENSAARIIVPTEDLGTGWHGGNEPYDDETWTSGLNGVGYERGGNNGIRYDSYIRTNVNTQMSGSTSCFLRIPFIVNENDMSEWDTLLFKIRYDDGFAAYINGRPVLSINAPASLNHLSSATEINEDGAAIIYRDFDLSDHLDALRGGDNILAIHGLNEGVQSSDFLIQAKLLAGQDSGVSSLPQSLFPLANDHDANGQTLTLESADTESAAGGTITQEGSQLIYTPPQGVSGSDWFLYEISDTAGKTAEGVVLVGSSLALSNLALNPSIRAIPSSGGFFNLDIESRRSWNWRRESEEQNWLTSGEAVNQNGSQTFSYSVGINTSRLPRRLNLIFDDGDTSAVHTVIQQGVEDTEGNSADTASLLEIGLPVMTGIGYPGDTDFFRLTIEDESLVTLRSAGSLDTVGILRDSTGSVLTQSNNSDDGANLNFAISYTLKPGIYYLQVRHNTRAGTGPYTLISRQLPVPEISLRSYNDAEEQAVVEISFTGHEGYSYRVESSTDLVVWTPIERGIRSEGEAILRSYALTPASSQKLFLRVSMEGAPGSLENPINLGVIGSERTTISVDTFLTTFDTELGLFNSDGDLLDSDDDTPNPLTGSNTQSQIQLPLPVAGTYYLAAAQYNTTFADGFSVSGGPSGGVILLNYNGGNSTGGLIGTNGHLWFSLEISP